jgi:NAD(P)H dehydrogenase (quinone)
MKCLVVTAHPLNDSLCKHLATNVMTRLESTGHLVTLEDLYAKSFQPVLTAKERESYYSDSYDSSELKEQVDRLLDAEGLVLVFPTWWYSFPAILKGWFDRVWGPGIAYDHTTDFGPIKPKLNQIKKVLVVTTLGAPWWIDRFIMWQPVKRVIKIALLGACARKSKLYFTSLYKCETFTKSRMAKFEARIEKILTDWK